MKKFLSLVLALVMTMSLVTVAGAADFTDDASVKYEEAVDVISALEIVNGYPDGSFAPKGTLTRGAAAKIICNILVGPKAAAELKAATAPFADVPADHVFAGYIAYCVNEGIISGYGDGNFGPSNQLTGYAFLKMLLTALGYDQTAEGYVGANSSVNILLDAKAVYGADDTDKPETSLIAGLDGTFDGTKAITREEACLFALNALQAQQVKYDEDRTNIKIGDIEIATGLGDAEPQGTLLYTVNFDKLTPDYDATSELGLPATTWSIDGEEDAIGTYAKKADLVVTNYAEDGDLYKLMGKTEAAEWGYEKDGETKVVDNGQIAYFYYDSTTPIYVETVIGNVTAVVEDDAEDEDDVAYVEITSVDGDVYYYETDKLAEEDLVIFYEDKLNTKTGYDYVAYNVSAPESKDGVITAVKGSEYIKVDGVKEVLSLNAVELEENAADVDLTSAGEDTYTFYYDYAGAIIAAELKEAAEETYNYVWVIDAEAEAAGENLLNSKKDVAKVKVLFMDGKVETVDYKISYATKDGDGLEEGDAYFTFNGEKVALTAGNFAREIKLDTFYAYTKDADGYSFRAIDNAKVAVYAEFIEDVDYTEEAKVMAGYNLTASSKFVTVGEDGSVKTKTGYKNMETMVDTDILVLHAKDSNKATVIYTVVEKESTSETVNYAYFVSAGETNKDGDVECTFWVGGKQVTYWVDETLPADVALGDMFDVTVEDGVASLAEVNYDYAGVLNVLDDEYMIVGETELEFAEEYEVYQVSLNKKTLTKASLAEEKNVQVFMNEDEVALVLIIHARNVEA